MPYVSIDELERFEFHDAELISIEQNEPCMKWITKGINATKENTQNHFQFDMCVSESDVVFESVEIKSITFAEIKTYNVNHELIQHEKPREASKTDYTSILNESTSAFCWIQGMCMEKAPADGKHKYAATFTLDGCAGYFHILLHFDRVVISWNEFSGKAWYEDDTWKKKNDT